MKSIKDLERYMLVTQDGEYSYVAICGHDNKYYALIGDGITARDDGFDIDNAVKVDDMFDDKLSQCCG
jgi:hypothetical protein